MFTRHFPFIHLVLFISVRKHSTLRRGNTKTIECLTLTYIFKCSFLIFKLVIDIKVRVSDFGWKTGGSGNTGPKISAGKHKLEPSARRCSHSVQGPPALGSLGFVTLPYSYMPAKHRFAYPDPPETASWQSGRKARIPLWLRIRRDLPFCDS